MTTIIKKYVGCKNCQRCKDEEGKLKCQKEYKIGIYLNTYCRPHEIKSGCKQYVKK